nr:MULTISPECIES: hypothetical protein [Mesorhizobium]
MALGMPDVQDLDCIGMGAVENFVGIVTYEENANVSDIGRVTTFWKFGKSRNSSLDPGND